MLLVAVVLNKAGHNSTLKGKHFHEDDYKKEGVSRYPHKQCLCFHLHVTILVEVNQSFSVSHDKNWNDNDGDTLCV